MNLRQLTTQRRIVAANLRCGRGGVIDQARVTSCPDASHWFRHTLEEPDA